MAYHKVTACGRICLHRKKINISIVLAGQTLGIKEVHDGIWLVSFMQYGIWNFDLEQRTLQPLDNPFGHEAVTYVPTYVLLPMSPGWRAKYWSEWQDLNLRPPRPERGALPDCATLRLAPGI